MNFSRDVYLLQSIQCFMLLHSALHSFAILLMHMRPPELLRPFHQQSRLNHGCQRNKSCLVLYLDRGNPLDWLDILHRILHGVW